MIKKDFTLHPEALELKELGFDEPCFGVYATKDGYVRKSAYDEIGNAPTYSQAFRWFRDKHGLCIVIKPIDDKKLDLGYNLLKNGLIMSAHLTYEEAELACLKKLIEIVKTN